MELGLLNPLIVQRAGRAWGVLAGGRRLAAMQHLAGDRAAKGWTMRTKVACRALGDDIAAATAVTLAENVTQRAMDPIDEYEAYARMMEVGGHDPDAIARLFGVERRRVVERLRYGRVHPDIRQAAARAREITLDVMKAFAEHPDREAQREAFEGVRGCYVTAWTIRDRLRTRGTRIGDPLGRLVARGLPRGRRRDPGGPDRGGLDPRRRRPGGAHPDGASSRPTPRGSGPSRAWPGRRRGGRSTGRRCVPTGGPTR